MPFLSDHPHIKLIQDIGRRKKVPVYLVGGYLRDFALGRPKNDFDFAVERKALDVARAFAKKINGAFVLLDEERGCARVAKKISGELHIYDFADYRARTIRGDIAHRDFTVNTLRVNLAKLRPATEIPEVLEASRGALKDLKDKRIKRVSARAFREDPLRMLRAFSLRAVSGFTIEKQTLDQIRRDKDLINGVSHERIRDELFKILETSKAPAVLRAMDRVGLLEGIIPQIAVMRGCKQGTYHHLDVWPHSLETVAQLERVLERARPDTAVAAYLSEDLGGNRSRQLLMKLAAFLHDIGKPDTRKMENGRISFHGHEHVGKNIVRHVAKMLKLSVRERHALEDMVRWHLRPGYLSNFKQPSEKAIYRYFRDTKEEAAAILLLSWADQRATRGPATTQDDQEHHERMCVDLIQRYFAKQQEKPFVRLINGHDLIKKLKLKPSPVFAKILSGVEEQQSLGAITTKSEALAWARELVEKHEHR